MWFKKKTLDALYNFINITFALYTKIFAKYILNYQLWKASQNFNACNYNVFIKLIFSQSNHMIQLHIMEICFLISCI